MNSNWDLIGHEWAVDMLKKHVVNGTTRHAYLFSGPPGLGRRTLAIEEVRKGLENRGIENNRAKLIAHISGGRFGYALRLVENDDLLEAREERLNELLTLLPASRVVKFAYADKLSKDRS